MSSRNWRDPMLPFDSDKCQCTICKLYFNSTRAFDFHRQAEKVPGRQATVLDRKCRSDDQLKALGWCVSKTGHWMSGRRSLDSLPNG